MVDIIAALVLMQPGVQVKIVQTPDTGPGNRYYVGNRAPLAPTPFIKLPIGAIRPLGWVKTQLDLEADGFTGRLSEISEFLQRKNNAWLSPTGEGVNGWEEVPYWLKGFGDLGYVLGDKRIQAEAKIWIDAVIAGQAENGWLGPRSNLVSNDGKPDMWPNMPMLFALRSWYEFRGDSRVLEAMRRYFRWQLDQPESDFLLSYWELQRGGDNIASVFWLYNRTGEPWLLDLARKIHRRTAPWSAGIPNWHGVNFAQGFREPAQMAALENDPALLQATERNYVQMRTLYGQTPGGMYGADENARPGFGDPRQATETCAMVEMMQSSEMLLTQIGDRKWAERCEDVAFNSLPASMTPDLKALRYLTAPNMALSDSKSKAPGLENSGPMLLFNPFDHRCCRHNVAMGWPYYAEHLWLATAGNGLAVALYAPSKVTAKVGDGTPVTIQENTRYPFEERVEFTFATVRPNSFPLTLRLPSWCASPKLTLNGKSVPIKGKGGYAVLSRTWKSGDKLVLELPMRIALKTWKANKSAVSVHRGPLTYSLKIGERYVRKGGTDQWPAYEAYPTAPWNYGLTPDTKRFKFVQKIWRGGQPFSVGRAPVAIFAPARKIPQWEFDYLGLVPPLQSSPARSNEPEERVTLVPMGAARLRISAFPTVSKDGYLWKRPFRPKKPLPAVASYIEPRDTVDALSDGLLPANSNDQSIPRFTWWTRKGTEEWVEYNLAAPRKVSSTSVYWFDDSTARGGCRTPLSWKLLYWTGSDWKEVQAGGKYGVEVDKPNTVRFTSVVSNRYRLVVKLRPGWAGGILEWILE